LYWTLVTGENHGISVFQSWAHALPSDPSEIMATQVPIGAHSLSVSAGSAYDVNNAYLPIGVA